MAVHGLEGPDGLIPRAVDVNDWPPRPIVGAFPRECKDRLGVRKAVLDEVVEGVECVQQAPRTGLHIPVKIEVCVRVTASTKAVPVDPGSPVSEPAAEDIRADVNDILPELAPTI